MFKSAEKLKSSAEINKICVSVKFLFWFIAKRPSLPKPSGSLTALHIASRGYNRRYRTDALLQKRSKEKRYGVSTRNQILPQFRCSHYTDGNRCTSRIIPFAVYCLRRILDGVLMIVSAFE